MRLYESSGFQIFQMKLHIVLYDAIKACWMHYKRATKLDLKRHFQREIHTCAILRRIIELTANVPSKILGLIYLQAATENAS